LPEIRRETKEKGGLTRHQETVKGVKRFGVPFRQDELSRQQSLNRGAQRREFRMLLKLKPGGRWDSLSGSFRLGK